MTAGHTTITAMALCAWCGCFYSVDGCDCGGPEDTGAVMYAEWREDTGNVIHSWDGPRDDVHYPPTYARTF